MIGLQENAIRKPRHLKPLRARSPVLAELVTIADARRYGYRNVARAAGCSSSVLMKMRSGQVPLFTAVERIATVMGYRIALLPLGPGGSLSAWALDHHGQIVDVTLDETRARAWSAKGWRVVRLVEDAG